MGFYQNATPIGVNQKDTLKSNYHVRFSIGKPVLNPVDLRLRGGSPVGFRYKTKEPQLLQVGVP